MIPFTVVVKIKHKVVLTANQTTWAGVLKAKTLNKQELVPPGLGVPTTMLRFGGAEKVPSLREESAPQSAQNS